MRPILGVKGESEMASDAVKQHKVMTMVKMMST